MPLLGEIVNFFLPSLYSHESYLNCPFPNWYSYFETPTNWVLINTTSDNISFSLSRGSKQFPWHAPQYTKWILCSLRRCLAVHQVWNIHNNLSAVYHQCPRVITCRSKTSNRLRVRACLDDNGPNVSVRYCFEMVRCVLHNCQPSYLFSIRNTKLFPTNRRSSGRKRLRYCYDRTKTELRCAFNRPWKRYFVFSVIKLGGASMCQLPTSFIIYLVNANARKT